MRLRGRVRLGWLIADYDVQAAFGVVGPQQLLVVLAHAGTRHRVHKRPLFRHPPLHDQAGQVRPEFFRGHPLARYGDYAGQRPLTPPFVGRGDDRGLADRRVGEDGRFQLQRGDPFTARLDDILGPVADRDVPLGVDPADVAGAQPAVAELLRRRVLVVAGRHPRPAHLDLAGGVPVAGHDLALVVHHPGLHAAERAARGGLVIYRAFRRAVLGREGQGCDRARLGQAPALDDKNAETLL